MNSNWTWNELKEPKSMFHNFYEVDSQLNINIIWFFCCFKWTTHKQCENTEKSYPLSGKTNTNNLQTSSAPPIKTLLFLSVLSLHLSLPCSLRHFLSIQMPLQITPLRSNSTFFSLLLSFFLWTAQVCHLNHTFYLLFPCKFFRCYWLGLFMIPHKVGDFYLFLG